MNECRLLNDRIGRFPVICTGLVLCGAGSLLLGPLPWLPLPPAGHASVWAAMVVLGFGVALAFTPITPAILQAAEAKVGTLAGIDSLEATAVPSNSIIWREIRVWHVLCCAVCLLYRIVFGPSKTAVDEG